MASKIVLHIGLQKSGTTFLQRMLQNNRHALAESGICYPISQEWARGNRTVANHEWSTYGLLGTEFPWISHQRASKESPSWQAVLDQVHAWPATALLSAEALSVIRTPAIRKLMHTLAIPETEIVITARSLDHALPSLWQQHIRNGHSVTFDDYLTTLANHRKNIEDDPAAHIWRAFILNKLVHRWTKAGATKITIVTTPGTPPHLLWDRFTHSIEAPALTNAPLIHHQNAHTGLTAPETLILASLNASLKTTPKRQAAQIRHLVTQKFQTRHHRGNKPAIPPMWRPHVTEWTNDDLTHLLTTPAHIIGNLTDLNHSPNPTPPPTPEEIAQAGAEATLALATHLNRSPLHRLRRHL